MDDKQYIETLYKQMKKDSRTRTLSVLIPVIILMAIVYSLYFTGVINLTVTFILLLAALIIPFIIRRVTVMRTQNYYWNKIFADFNSLMADKCDTARFEELMKMGCEYGWNLGSKIDKLQKNLLEWFQMSYAIILIINMRGREAGDFYDNQWRGGATRSKKAIGPMVRMARYYDEWDLKNYKAEKAKALSGTRDLVFNCAGEEILQGDYDSALEILEKRNEVNNLYDNIRQYLIGLCYIGKGDENSAEKYMRYVSEHGNTMAQKVQADSWLEERLSPQSAQEGSTEETEPAQEEKADAEPEQAAEAEEKPEQAPEDDAGPAQSDGEDAPSEDTPE